MTSTFPVEALKGVRTAARIVAELPDEPDLRGSAPLHDRIVEERYASALPHPAPQGQPQGQHPAA